jgi:hypothetical protein
MPGDHHQNIAFGGFVTALGSTEDLRQGAHRPLPVAWPMAARGARGADLGRRRHERAAIVVLDPPG